MITKDAEAPSIIQNIPMPQRSIAIKAPATFKILLAFLALYFIWGSTYFAIRIGLSSFPPFLMAGYRFLIAGGALYLFLRLRGESSPTPLQWRNATTIGVLLLLGGNGGVTFAEQWIPSGLAALGVATIPLWAALFGGIWGRWPSKYQALGLGVGFVGVILLNLDGNLKGHPAGEIAIFLAAICWAFGSTLSPHLSLPKGLMASAAEMLAGGALMIVVGCASHEHLTQMPSMASIISVLYLIAFGSLIAYPAYLYLLNNVSASVATSYAYVNPLVAVAIGWKLGHESVTLHALLAALLIVGSVAFITLSPKPKPIT